MTSVTFKPRERTAPVAGTGYQIRQSTGRKWLHMDPLNGIWWGPKMGALTYVTVEDAASAVPSLVPGIPFAIVPTKTEG